MHSFKTYKGSNKDLVHYKGATINEYLISILQQDCTPFDLSVYDDIIFSIYSKRDGTLLKWYSLLEDDINLSSPEGSFLLTILKNEFNDLIRLDYYHDCFGILPNDEKDLLFYGVSQLN